MEFSAEVEDSEAEVLAVLKATGGLFELLDFAVEAYAHGIGDSLTEAADDLRPILLEQLGLNLPLSIRQIRWILRTHGYGSLLEERFQET